LNRDVWAAAGRFMSEIAAIQRAKTRLIMPKNISPTFLVVNAWDCNSFVMGDGRLASRPYNLSISKDA
jgi:hypothetical protein